MEAEGMTYESIEYDRPARKVRGELVREHVEALGYDKCLIDGQHVDPATVRVIEDDGELD